MGRGSAQQGRNATSATQSRLRKGSSNAIWRRRGKKKPEVGTLGVSGKGRRNEIGIRSPLQHPGQQKEFSGFWQCASAFKLTLMRNRTTEGISLRAPCKRSWQLAAFRSRCRKYQKGLLVASCEIPQNLQEASGLMGKKLRTHKASPKDRRNKHKLQPTD